MKLPFELQIRWSNNLKWARRKAGGEWYRLKDTKNYPPTIYWTQEKPWNINTPWYVQVIEQEVYY